MALPMPLPVASKTVVAMPFSKRFVISQQIDDLRKQCLNVLVQGCRFDSLVIALECRGSLNRPH